LVVKKAKKFDESILLKLKDYLNDGKIDAARSLCESNNSPVARMLEKGLSRIGHPIEDINSAMENKAKLEMFELEKNLSLLATLAGAGPLMGLIGTVVGMVITFYSISVSGKGVQIDALAGGVYQAMIATVGGLIVGIIAYIGYNLFVASVQKIVHQMETTGVELVEILQQKVK
jgi:biopolymer transport protein ExbB